MRKLEEDRRDAGAMATLAGSNHAMTYPGESGGNLVEDLADEHRDNGHDCESAGASGEREHLGGARGEQRSDEERLVAEL
eukprot:scaffold221312_cov31-Tisochrysis_lutea.AAC.2